MSLTGIHHVTAIAVLTRIMGAAVHVGGDFTIASGKGRFVSARSFQHVTVKTVRASHGLVQDDIIQAQQWLAEQGQFAP
jgi:hypothetical protein